MISIRGRKAFTLVELMIVMAIVVVLSGMMAVAIGSASESAKVSATRATIVKLHGLVMTQWESFAHRRLAFQLPASVERPTDFAIIPPPPEVAAQARCDGIRLLMRMEMPERWSDISAGGTDGAAGRINLWYDPIKRVPYASATEPGQLANASVAPSAISASYQQFFLSVSSTAGFETNGYNHQGAKCLYLFLTMGLEEPDVMENFSAGETADVDGSGCRCFVDAWGNPIEFLRWAPGYKSALQPSVPTDPDQTDPTGVYGSPNPPAGVAQTFALYPLIYSAGPDGYYDIVNEEDSPNTLIYSDTGIYNNPYYSMGGAASVYFSQGAVGTPAIQPVTDQATGRQIGNADNIDNHSLGAH